MKARSMSVPVLFGPLLFSSLSLVFLSGCATTRTADQGSSTTDSVDIGYGSVEEDRLPGSVATVRNDDTYKSQPRTVAEMLRRIPGVQVVERTQGRLSVRIRGSASFVGGEEPLWVIDGMTLPSAEVGLNSLNPRNIESITVLKNADAVAIYGSRGANGVILVKTKRR